MSENLPKKALQTQMWGWVLFLACGVLFTISGARAKDPMSIAAGIAFLLGCLFFVIPLLKAIRQADLG